MKYVKNPYIVPTFMQQVPQPSSSSSSSSPSLSSYDEKSDATWYFSVRWSIETLGFSLTTITIVIGKRKDKKDILVPK
ncbi:LOW QUALITY PROTEIN: hypothetical protein PanWU01x14_335620 [Parasponia andersonii]|uniref:Transmembrane protein n=1 Tax=Parasponia andersonii TaxID=3476 RepID=A0A2P5AG90_PARAD|nr:LOW QUALITY PROTEIN: hypothetical protein PanWU01x14_335620 [Parasponia andersonii]